MTKEEWIKVKKEPYISLGVWFSYYKENGGLIDDPIIFEREFNRIINHHLISYDRNRQVYMHVTNKTASERLFNYYDTIFCL